MSTKSEITENGAVVQLVQSPTPLIRLHTLDDLRLEMARVYREMRARTIDPGEGTKLAYVLGQMVQLFELSKQQQRIETIESTLNLRNPDK